MKKIACVLVIISLIVISPGCMMFKNPQNKSNSKDVVKDGTTTTSWNTRKKSFHKPKYQKMLKKQERMVRREKRRDERKNPNKSSDKIH